MEVNEQNLQALSAYLAETFNPSTRKQAEKYLQSIEVQQGFPVLVLNLVDNPSVDPAVRTAAVLLLKNFVKRNWATADEETNKVAPSDRETIKSRIVGLMITLPTRLQVQLSEAIAIIADEDFPENWPNLIQELVSNLSPTDYSINNGVLQTAHSIFKRWRGQFRSDKLFTMIKEVLRQFCGPYLQLFQNTDRLIDENATSAENLKLLFQTMHLLVKIFLSLNYQDLPEFFEDNLDVCFGLLHKYLMYSNPVLEAATEDMDEGSPVEKVKGAICEVVELYTTRYDEEFKNWLPKFVETIWGLLVSAGSEERYDILVSKGMTFLTTVVKSNVHKSLFESPVVLTQICEKIGLPNLVLRERDIEMFEDEPMEYVKRDLEGSDSDTRRRAAVDLIRGMMDLFEREVTDIMGKYITQYLQSYAANPQANWKDKDTAVTLLTAIAARNVAQQHGATRVNEAIDVVKFFSDSILGDLQSPTGGAGVHPVLKVDAIKFLHTFRQQLTKDQMRVVFPLLVEHLTVPNYAVHTYAAICIERILFTRREKAFVFSPEDIKPFAQNLLINLFKLVEANPTPEKLAENDYLMKAIMRVIIISRADMLPYVETILEKLSTILKAVSKNPSNPKFNHYVFESISALVRFICSANPSFVAQFEERIWPPFQEILSEYIVEFTPYVFQIISQMLEYHPEGGIPPAYMGLLTPILAPTLWEHHGNVPALVRLLTTYVQKGPNVIAQKEQLQPILGIFQRLIASKANDHHAFDLMENIIYHIPINAIQPFLKPIITLMLTRLQSKKTPKYTKAFIQFIGYFLSIDKEGLTPDIVIQAFDSIQASLFQNLLETVVVPEVANGVTWMTEKKTCAVGYTRLLVQSEMMISEPYIRSWPSVLGNVLTILEGSMVGIDVDEELNNFDLEENGYQASFSRLAAAGRAKDDPASRITDPKKFFVDGLTVLTRNHPDKIPAMLQPPTISPEEVELLHKYTASVSAGPIR